MIDYPATIELKFNPFNSENWQYISNPGTVQLYNARFNTEYAAFYQLLDDNGIIVTLYAISSKIPFISTIAHKVY